jgi:hypothetical protein
MKEHPKDNSISDGQPDGQQILLKSRTDSDRKFWSGERPVSVVQWLGVLLLYFAMALLALTSNHRVSALVLGGLVLFVLLGNRWARRRGRHRSTRV